jgi:DNA repair exonuclease SbcCD ATPase subunit
MARSGLYKSEVKRARDALLSQGKYPSVDAVRIALGNTGSKTTIHKYLRELDEDEGGAGGSKISISEALQDLVSRLAAELHVEANVRIDAIQVEAQAAERRHAEAKALATQEIAALTKVVQDLKNALASESTAHELTRERLQNEAIARHTAEQQVIDIRERLAENESHRKSLEEKHQHAREALEHYRESVREQRSQDQRQHEQQMQQLRAEIRHLQQALVVKQEDVTRLNQEGARLVADLSHAQKALHDEGARIHRLEQRLEEASNRSHDSMTAELHAIRVQLGAIKSKSATNRKRASAVRQGKKQ